MNKPKTTEAECREIASRASIPAAINDLAEDALSYHLLLRLLEELPSYHPSIEYDGAGDPGTDMEEDANGAYVLHCDIRAAIEGKS